MIGTPDLLTGASQIAAMMAQRSGPGFSKDPADYQPTRAKFNGREFNSADPKYARSRSSSQLPDRRNSA